MKLEINRSNHFGMLETLNTTRPLHGSPWSMALGFRYDTRSNKQLKCYGHEPCILKHLGESLSEGEATPVCKSTGSPRCSSIGSANDLNRHIGLEVNVLI